jgi:hypothetical protein
MRTAATSVRGIDPRVRRWREGYDSPVVMSSPF